MAWNGDVRVQVGGREENGWADRLTIIVAWVFVVSVATILAVAFGQALSKLQDAVVIGVGVIALAAGVVGVGLQGMFVASQIESRDAVAMMDPNNLLGQDRDGDPDRFSVKSYGLLANPVAMRMLGGTYTVAQMERQGVSFKEPGFVNCNGIISRMEVHYNADPLVFLVINPGATSATFQADVSQGRVTSILMGGMLYRILYLNSLDFEGSDAVALRVLESHDVYALSVRGPEGASPAVDETGCEVVEIRVPWKVDPKDAVGVSEISVSNSTVVPIQVWGVGGR